MSDIDISQQSGSAARTLRVLAYVAANSQSVQLAELSAALELPKPTLHRICQSLLETGMLTRDVDEKAFLIGPALRQLAFSTLNNGTLSGLRHSVLTDLVNETGETCNFTTLDGASVMYLDRVETQHAWRLTIEIGERVPVHCTASGKLFLAMLPAAKRNYLLKRLSLQRLTDNTLTDVAQLREQLDPIATQGFAEDHQEFVVGLIAIAVPVYNDHDTVRAAIAMHSPTNRLTIEQLRDKLPALQAAAKRMGELL